MIPAVILLGYALLIWQYGWLGLAAIVLHVLIMAAALRG
jgi:hypothetical protein